MSEEENKAIIRRLYQVYIKNSLYQELDKRTSVSTQSCVVLLSFPTFLEV